MKLIHPFYISICCVLLVSSCNKPPVDPNPPVNSGDTTINDWNQHYNVVFHQGFSTDKSTIQDTYDVYAGITMGKSTDYSGRKIVIVPPASISANGDSNPPVPLTPTKSSSNTSLGDQVSPGDNYNYHVALTGASHSITFTAVDNFKDILVNTFPLPTKANDPTLTLKCAISTNSQMLLCNMDEILPQFTNNLNGYSMDFYPIDNGIIYNFKKASSNNMFLLYGNSDVTKTPIPNMQIVFSKQFNLQKATDAGGEFFSEYDTPPIVVIADPTKPFDPPMGQ